MPTILSVRRNTLLLLAAVLAVPSASFAGSESPRTWKIVAPAAPDVLNRLWSFLARKNGCQVDPNGRCLPQGTPLGIGDNGCGLDPSGRCRDGQSPAPTKNGCEFDPNGRCLP
jgi:hypothetical protein